MAAFRFGDLVKSAGVPEPKTLWTDPKNDREFMKAVEQNRVLTVVQQSKKKDFGEMGFRHGQGALYFVFPKPLPAGKGKVIGIKYDLAESGEPKDRVSVKDLKRASKRAQVHKPKAEAPKTKTFHVIFRRSAEVETNVLVEAHSEAEAREKSKEMIKGEAFDLAQAKIKSEIKIIKSA